MSLTSTLVIFPTKFFKSLPEGEGIKTVLAEYEIEEDVIGSYDDIIPLMIFNTRDERALDYLSEKIPSLAIILEDRDNCYVALFIQKDFKKVIRKDYSIPENRQGDSDYETDKLDEFTSKALKIVRKTLASW